MPAHFPQKVHSPSIPKKRICKIERFPKFTLGFVGVFAGFGKLAAVYVVSLCGFVIWVGLLISWLFFAGFTPPLAG